MSDPIAEITDHVAEAQARVVGALKEKNRYVSLLASVVIQFGPGRPPSDPDPLQDLETVFFELLQKRSLTNAFDGKKAVGVQLDNLGKIMGLARYSGQSDVEYRLDLISWVRFLFSQGEGDTLLFVLKALTNSTTVSISETFPGSVILYFDGVIYNEENLSSLMDRCAAAGIGVDLVPVSDTTFRYDTPGVGYDEGLYTIALRTE